MLVAALVSLIYKDGATTDITLAAISTMFSGMLFMLATKKHKKEVQRKEGYIIVTFGWIVMSLSGMLPYLFSGAIPGVTNAFFETISGYTTTGASIVDDIEALIVAKSYPLDRRHGYYSVGYSHSSTFRYWWNAVICCRGPWPKCR